ncbi:hypothetical protein QFC19_001475 [Naganishia cerealis]|uniref:Uncharacterized protein n=1 Tax=Naganishia cerealis TaxID=610337 RepID=A0ACC2WGV1_9TREE|nr:hypothetical protein QFC19_001475 [Naganishia cerealis]
MPATPPHSFLDLDPPQLRNKSSRLWRRSDKERGSTQGNADVAPAPVPTNVSATTVNTSPHTLPVPRAARAPSTDVQSLASMTTTSTSGSGSSGGPHTQQQQQPLGTRMSSWFTTTFLNSPTPASTPSSNTHDHLHRRPRETTPSPASSPPSGDTPDAAAHHPRRSPGPRRTDSGTIGETQGGGRSSRRRREWRKSPFSDSTSALTVTSEDRDLPTTTTTTLAVPASGPTSTGTSNGLSPASPAAAMMSGMTTLLSTARTKAITSVRLLLDSEAHPDGSEETIWMRGGVRFSYVHDEPLLVSASAAAADGKDSRDRDDAGHEKGKGLAMGMGKARGKTGGRWGKKVSDGGGGGAAEYAWPPGCKSSLSSFPSPSLFSRARTNRIPTPAYNSPPRLSIDGMVHLPFTVRPYPHAQGGRGTGPNSDQGKSSAWTSWMGNMTSGTTGGDGNCSPTERGLTADSGWGCMLRTGQSLLANALVHYHLGRDTLLGDTGRGPVPVSREQRERYATYIQILSWFMDDPAPMCPFSVHRMALAGKRLGKEVGEWFGPSTAAGAVKTLANGFPLCGLAIVTATDSTIYASQVVAASHQPLGEWAQLFDTLPVRRRPPSGAGEWGGQGVLILAGVRLGMEGVNPLYHDSIKALFTFPQFVGIAGGRPGSSYYFIGCQGDNLFYLDPHFTRPAIPFKSRAEARNPNDPSTTMTSRVSNQGDSDDDRDDGDRLSAHVDWLLNVYTSDQLKTFHCDKVKRMPISSLDPSMLMGFLCKDNDDWLDLRERLNNLPQRIISIENTVPTWGDDSDDPDIESFTDTDVDEESIEVSSSPINISKVALEIPSPGLAGVQERAAAESESDIEFEEDDEVVLAAPRIQISASLVHESTDRASPYTEPSKSSPPSTPTLSASQRRDTQPTSLPHDPSAQSVRNDDDDVGGGGSSLASGSPK